MAVSGAWALTPNDGDTWDDATKTLTVNSNPGSSSYSSKTEIEHLIISAGVTSIGEWAFYNCSNLAIVYIQRSTTPITALGDGAFYHCGDNLVIAVPSVAYNDYYNATDWNSYQSKLRYNLTTIFNETTCDHDIEYLD